MKLKELTELSEMIHKSVEIMSRDTDIISTLTDACDIDFSFKEDLIKMQQFIDSFMNSKLKSLSKTTGFKYNIDSDIVKNSKVDPRDIKEIIPYNTDWKLHEVSNLYYHPTGNVAVRSNDNLIVLNLCKDLDGYLHTPRRHGFYPMIKSMKEVFFKNKPNNCQLVLIDGNKENININNMEYRLIGTVKHKHYLSIDDVNIICEYLVAFNGRVTDVSRLLPKYERSKISNIALKNTFTSISDKWFYIGPNKKFIPIKESTIIACDLDQALNDFGCKPDSLTRHTIINNFFKDKKRSDVSNIDISRLIQHYSAWVNSDDIFVVFEKLSKRFPQLKISIKDVLKEIK